MICDVRVDLSPRMAEPKSKQIEISACFVPNVGNVAKFAKKVRKLASALNFLGFKWARRETEKRITIELTWGETDYAQLRVKKTTW